MSRDISKLLREAKIQSANWSLKNLQSIVAEARQQQPTLRIDWDVGAGERWVRFLDGDHVRAILRTDLPLAVIDQKNEELARLLRSRGVLCLTVDGFNTQALSAEAGLVVAVLGPVADAFHEMNFTAADLWWATV